ncbi:hypothetical protein B0H17DRAFT_1205878 [Mycena rosella]|uniref:Uncharacterized protein n=1 Tax=Mycena rosella TaxID=1033263 RepID=A0AAD7D6I4_MYCRO|nr:hypothetical protein B0H17DRAFT_1205878 [Mycena rosella]
MSDSLAAIRLFSRFEGCTLAFPPPNGPGIKRAWNSTPNNILATSDEELHSSSGEGDDIPRLATTLLPEDSSQISDLAPTANVVRGNASSVDASVIPRRAQSISLNASAPVFHSLSHPVFQPTLPSVAPACAVPSSRDERSPPPSPRCAPAILNSKGEREFRHYQKMLDSEIGVSTCLRALLGYGVQRAGSAQPAAQLAHRLIAGRTDDLRARIRSEALGMFNLYWREDGAWQHEIHEISPYILSRGVNIAGFMGSLHRVGILSGRDAHRCLDSLLWTGLHFLRLLAAHALFVQCGDRICAGDSGVQTAILKERISARRPDGRFVRGAHDEGYVLILDLLDNIDRWFAAQEMKSLRAEDPSRIIPGTTPHNTPEGSAGSSPTLSSVTVMTPRTQLN